MYGFIHHGYNAVHLLHHVMRRVSFHLHTRFTFMYSDTLTLFTAAQYNYILLMLQCNFEGMNMVRRFSQIHFEGVFHRREVQ